MKSTERVTAWSDALLTKLRDTTARLKEQRQDGESGDAQSLIDQLVELIDQLDTACRAGDLPREWRPVVRDEADL